MMLLSSTPNMEPTNCPEMQKMLLYLSDGGHKLLRRGFTQPLTEKQQNTRGNAQCDHVEKKAKTREADSFRNTKIKISYTPEDGHIGRNM
jgi:uncharacterized protein YneR